MTCDLMSLWQRFGRGGRGEGTEAVAVLLAEKKYFATRLEVGVGVENGTATRKRKRDAGVVEEPPGKRKGRKGMQQSTSRPGEGAAAPRKRKTSSEESSEDTHLTKRPRLVNASTEGSSAPIDPSSPPNTAPNMVSSRNSEPEGTTQPAVSQASVEERRKRYHSIESEGAQGKGRKTTGKGKREVVPGSAMDDFINAGSHPGLSCRREVLNVYFENDKCGESHDRLIIRLVF